MSEEFNYYEERDKFSGWAFIASLVGKSKEMKATTAGERNLYTVEMKINGVEVSFTNVVKRLKEDFDYRVHKEAQRLVEERMIPLEETLEEFNKLLKNKISELFPDNQY